MDKAYEKLGLTGKDVKEIQRWMFLMMDLEMGRRLFEITQPAVIPA